MSLTLKQRELYQYCDQNDYVAHEMVEKFRKELEQEGRESVKSLSFALEKFVENACPKCNAEGLFKFRFLGRLVHNPGCNWTWYVKPGTYAVAQLSKVFHAGMEAGGGIFNDGGPSQLS